MPGSGTVFTGDLGSKIDQVWNTFQAGGIANLSSFS